MPKITSVESQKKNPQRFNIFLDGQYAFGADKDSVINFRLLPGKDLSPDELNRLLLEVEIGKLMERIYRLFVIRQRSEAEIRQYFKIQNYKLLIKNKEQISDSLIDLIIERLKNKGMINDLIFAKSWIEARRRSKNLGTIAVKSELVKKGVSREIISELIANTKEIDEQLAVLALKKRINRWKNLSNLAFRKKATEYLLRKGFEYEVIKKVIGKQLRVLKENEYLSARH